MWKSYKKFCSDRVRDFDRATAKFGFIRSGFGVAWTFFLWYFGTVAYIALAVSIFSLRLLWWLLKLLIFGVRWIVAKLFDLSKPTFPSLFKTRSISNMSGEEFERYVGDKLREKGYHDIEFTPISGDYGVDIIAVKGGVKYAFQCKRYAAPVGVKAVQEVFSGSRFYDADQAVVVTNSSYTPKAKALANDLGVTLWDLEMFDAIF